MIEHLKNIGSGLWCIGLSVVCCMCVAAITYTIIAIGNLTIAFPAIMIPIIVLVIAWAIGKFVRPK